jgi:probable FeS assembly SUF system protein SufT
MDFAVTLIPSGQTMILREGETVIVTQALGGSVTVQTERGYLARIETRDLERLGFGHLALEHEDVAEGPFELEQVYDRLRTVFDPEIPVNVVDLGLIYECAPFLNDDGTYRMEIKMSMTAPGCGMGDVLTAAARDRVLTAPGVSEVNVELVWDPPWGMERMSEAAKLQLGLY